MTQQYAFPQPPNWLFKQEQYETILNEKSVTYLMEKVEVVETRGILCYYKGTPYARKGFPTPQAIFALNQIKKLLLEFSKLLKNPFFLLGVLFSNKTQLCQSFNDIFNKQASQIVIKDEYMCRCAFNFANFTHSMLLGMKVDHNTAKQFAFNLAQILEYDDAYRYRVQDIMTELNVEWFKENPRKEIQRLIKIWKSRDLEGVNMKLDMLLYPLIIVLPLIKKKLIKNIMFLKQMEYDADDRYWACMRADYKFLGMTLQERLTLYTERPHAIEVMS